MYHPYREGYSVLPRLKRISREDVFQVTAGELEQFRQLKQQAVAQQVCQAERNCPDGLKEDVRRYILHNYPYRLDPELDLQGLSLNIAEDFVLHCMDEQKDWMALGYVYLPSGWRPDRVIGESFDEVHSVIPGMNLSQSRKLVQACIDQGPFERFVWGPVFSEELNLHPDRPRAAFDPQNPKLFVKVERQVLLGFPEHHALLFLLKQSLIPERDLDKAALRQALAGMTPEQLRYKGLTEIIHDLLDYLAE